MRTVAGPIALRAACRRDAKAGYGRIEGLGCFFCGRHWLYKDLEVRRGEERKRQAFARLGGCVLGVHCCPFYNALCCKPQRADGGRELLSVLLL